MKTVLLLAAGLVSISLFSRNITLEEAVTQHLVTVKVFPRKMDDWTSYYGQCMSIQVSNKSHQAINLEIVPGQYLEPKDTSTQRMVTTHHQVLALGAGSTQEVSLYAMCSEQSDASPDMDDAFVLGMMAQENVQRIAQYIQEHNWQNGTGQHAMWVITDDASLDGITDGNVDAVNALRRAVADIKGIEFIAYEPTPEEQYQNGLTSLSGNFTYEVPRNCRASLTLEDVEGRLVATFFRDKPFTPGTHKFSFSADELSLRPGKYKVMLRVNGRLAARYEMEVP